MACRRAVELAGSPTSLAGTHIYGSRTPPGAGPAAGTKPGSAGPLGNSKQPQPILEARRSSHVTTHNTARAQLRASSRYSTGSLVWYRTPGGAGTHQTGRDPSQAYGEDAHSKQGCAKATCCHAGVQHERWLFECHWLRKGQLNRHTRYRPATTTRNTATQWSRRSVD